MNTIVLYYSKSGTTEKLAERICADLDCSKLRIEPEQEYGSYISAVARVAKEKLDKVTPSFVTAFPDLTAYDVIFLGYPVWYHDIPAFVAEFVKHCDLNRKTVIPFATFGGTGIKWTMKTLENICQGAVIKYPFNYGMLKKDNYDKWISNIRKV